MSGFGDEPARSAREALAIATGEMEPARMHVAEDGKAPTVHAARR